MKTAAVESVSASARVGKKAWEILKSQLMF